MDPTDLTLHEAAEAMRGGGISSREYTAACLERVRRVDPVFGAFVEVYGEEALEAAVAADRRRAAGEPGGALAGVPVAVKDNICAAGRRAGCASKILDGFVAPYDATAVERLRAAGAIILGRTNMDEFAMGSSTETSSRGVTRNPWDPERVPGGSSGGSAAAVAAREVPAALGTDTGGSIRQPAALCGVAGLKPTYGRVSRFGLVAFASSLDQIGPIARSVRDLALLLEVIGGHDGRDSTSAEGSPRGLAGGLDRGIEGLRVGVPEEFFAAGVDGEVRASVEASVGRMRDLGAAVVGVRLPHTPYAVATYYIVATAEASSNLARYDGVQYGLRAADPRDLPDLYERTRAEGLGPEVKRRIMLGTYVLSAGYHDAYYLKALKVRTLMRRDFEEAFGRCDVIATPTAPTAAFALGEKTADPLTMYLSDICTISASLAGIPAISVPCGFTAAGLPVGLQLMARPFEEGTLLRAAHAYEQATDWHRRRPPDPAPARGGGV
ncbi:MAG: Asp-tRNA(Asn)/Glu-tRNA(Gln) amidotransferase subunit GatA [bacterium]|nr:Asp-tRNA(Asn)/Glu-tRNA(Gln) amidotransferase subunit GatA [bacterium]